MRSLTGLEMLSVIHRWHVLKGIVEPGVGRIKKGQPFGESQSSKAACTKECGMV